MTPDADRLLTLRELADYLRLGERTVLKLATQGEIPGARIGNQWRFKLSVIDAWLGDQMLGVRGGRPPEVAAVALADCFGPAHVLAELQGTSRSAVLEELARHAQALGLVRDSTWFLGALLERENVLTSAIGDGVAFPHTLSRHPEQVTRPFVLLGRARGGVDFDAADREPVRLVVLLGLRFQELHLPWLARLSALLRGPAIRERLLAADADPDVLHRIVADAVAGDG